jgi:hypothetical protein
LGLIRSSLAIELGDLMQENQGKQALRWGSNLWPLKVNFNENLSLIDFIGVVGVFVGKKCLLIQRQII